MLFRPFDYKTLEDLKKDINEMGLDLPLSEDLTVLAQPINIYGKTVKNRLAIQPHEGSHADTNGAPNELAFRRYRRYAAGGAGLIWLESQFTTKYAKTNPYMMGINNANLDVFSHFFLDMKEAAKDSPPFIVVQLTHCGRGSVLHKMPGFHTPPKIAYENPYLPIDNAEVLTDDEVYGIIDDYVRAAALYKKAGADCVDVRACHGYLLVEFLSAYTRKNSVFGGSFENRTRMLLTIIDRINSEVGIPVACRLNATDLIPYPYGFGMKEDGSMEPDYTEPVKLAKILLEKGVQLINISMGRNHANHILSPSDKPSPFQKKHQLYYVSFFHSMASYFKKALPDAAIMTGTFSWLRQFAPYVAAGGILSGHYDLAGFAKTAMANPDFANDILEKGVLKPEKLCINCGLCGQLFGASVTNPCCSGCVTRDPEYYKPYANRYLNKKLLDDKPAIAPENVYPGRLFAENDVV